MKEKEEKTHWKEKSKLERIKMEKDGNKRQTGTNEKKKKKNQFKGMEKINV
jgi:hypothetical protein